MGWRPTLAVLTLALVQALGNDYQLPTDVAPTHYDIKLAYDIDPNTNFSFFGVVDILLTVRKPTSKIVLHSQDFNIVNKEIKLRGPSSVSVQDVKHNDTYNLLTIQLSRQLERNGNYSLVIPFYGNLKTGLDGVYISTYVHKTTKAKDSTVRSPELQFSWQHDVNSTLIHLVTTQFEAISARKGFPCFDEPIYKATFKISIGHEKFYTAVSNMPLISSDENTNAMEPYWKWDKLSKTFKKPKTNFVWDIFQNSVPMSTYLVAFVVSKFDYVDSPPELSHTKFRIWARSDAIDQTAYAAKIGPQVLTYFEKWFNVSYPLPKQDMVAIPDFSAGAMENWGLITYRETALLYDKKQSSFTNKERIAEVIAHELAHQWFGNLVTMKWWSDLWLNEGFATFMASVAVADVEPTWNADRGYAIENIMAVLNLDALESSHPVSVPIDDPKRIGEIFDEISYKKGSTLIRMMTMFLGEEVFRKALHNYLIKYSYSNAEQDDLWSELTSAVQLGGGLSRNVTVKQIMDTWTTQTGYPLLTIHRDYTSNTLTIAQKRYLSSGDVGQSSSWWVPLRVVCEGESWSAEEGAGALWWLAAHEGVTSLHRFEHGAARSQWLLFNPDMLGLYRANYDRRNWLLLSKTLASPNYEDIPMMGRVQLLSDAFELAWSDYLDYNITLQIARYLRHEKEYLPLMTGLRALGKIENVLRRTPDYGAFQKFCRRLISDTYARVGGLAKKTILEPDNLIGVKMQTLTSGWACRMKVPGCEENAIEMFQQWMDTDNPDENNPIPLDLRKTVYCVSLSRGSVQHWRFALARAARANVAAARDALLHALTCTREVWMLAQYLEWAVTEGSEVRRQDAGMVISGIARSNVGYYVARDFFYTRIEDIHRAFKGQTRRIGAIIKVLLEQIKTERELDEFLKWRDENSKYLEDAKLAVDQAVERARVNIDWLRTHRRAVIDKMRELSKETYDDSDVRGGRTSQRCGNPVLCFVFVITIILFT
ncbi:aminopeptidase N-like isoform X2 [Plodia interpunctella]|uniref:aminopeptidase N-like isoform X2 n=1 Tax=Plodia interpunctella TaxID=58824 RepID=UPI00236895B8|nr:aminopeptidase N-like isoform X2 [Plodia interpunctella]